MQRIVVLNPKGGSGKTTIAINLASYLATRRYTPVLMDFDPQGSTLRWVRKRRPAQAPIHAIAAKRSRSQASEALEMSSRRKISLWLYREWIMSFSSSRTSA